MLNMRTAFVLTAIVLGFASAHSALAVVNAPTDLPGVRLWLDGNDVDGDFAAEGAGETYVNTWVDKSGLANNFVAPTAPTRSLGALGGKDVLTFNGTNQFFTGPSAILAANDDDYTYIAVFKSNTAAGAHSVYEQNGPVGTPSARSALLQVNGAFGFNGESNDRHDLVPINAGSYHVTLMTVDNALNPNNIKILDNGVGYAGTTGNPAALSVGTVSTNVGRKANNAEFMNGDIAEIVVYDRVLSDPELSDVNAYLAGKWSVAVAPSGLDALAHRWSFNDGTANDSIGTAHGTLFNGASIGGGKLTLDGVNDYLRTAPINSTITNKTLVAWVSLDNLAQRSGGLLTLENPTGADTFDSIVYGERTAGQWMNGSNFFNRSNGADNGGALESSLAEIMMAIVYRPGGGIDIYRDGSLYATYNTTGPISYPGGTADVLMGLRHEDISGGVGTLTGNDQFLAGMINEARIYSDALSPEQIALLARLGPNQLEASIPEPVSASLLLLAGLGLIGRRRRR